MIQTSQTRMYRVAPCHSRCTSVQPAPHVTTCRVTPRQTRCPAAHIPGDGLRCRSVSQCDNNAILGASCDCVELHQDPPSSIFDCGMSTCWQTTFCFAGRARNVNCCHPIPPRQAACDRTLNLGNLVSCSLAAEPTIRLLRFTRQSSSTRYA